MRMRHQSRNCVKTVKKNIMRCNIQYIYTATHHTGTQLEISARPGMEWNGMEWNGMEWNGMEWNGIESV